MLTELQKKKLPNLFAVQDTDKDGDLEWSDFEEFTRNLMTMRGRSSDSPEYQEMLARCRRYWDGLQGMAGPSGDQRISLQKWLGYQEQILGTPGMYESFSKPIGQMVWQIMDGDGDGSASPDDYKAIYTWRGLDPQLAAENFKRLDLNGDGLLTLDEIKVLIEQFYRSDDPQQPGNWFFGPF